MTMKDVSFNLLQNPDRCLWLLFHVTLVLCKSDTHGVHVREAGANGV